MKEYLNPSTHLFAAVTLTKRLCRADHQLTIADGYSLVQQDVLAYDYSLKNYGVINDLIVDEYNK